MAKSNYISVEMLLVESFTTLILLFTIIVKSRMEESFQKTLSTMVKFSKVLLKTEGVLE